jgi:hypothetical protein
MTDKNKRDDRAGSEGLVGDSPLEDIVWSIPEGTGWRTVSDFSEIMQKPMISLPSSPNAFTDDDIDETLGLGDIPDEMPERLGNAEEEQQAAWQAAREMGGGGASSPTLLGSDSQQFQAVTTPESVSEISAAIPEALGGAAIPEALGGAAIPEALGVAGSAAGVGLGVAGAAAAEAGFEAIKTAVAGPAGTRPGSIRDYTPESASGGGGGGIGDAMATQMIMSINKLAGTHSRL